jgi:hypothetical protein
MHPCCCCGSGLNSSAGSGKKSSIVSSDGFKCILCSINRLDFTLLSRCCCLWRWLRLGPSGKYESLALPLLDIHSPNLKIDLTNFYFLFIDFFADFTDFLQICGIFFYNFCTIICGFLHFLQFDKKKLI